MHRFSRRPSPAMAVAFIALLAALSGTAVALPGKNTVDSGDIVNNTVRSKDLRNNNVHSRDIRNSTVRGGDVRNNTLTGADINESTLGTVPSANTANSATSANTANTATSANTANTATNAGNADTLDGNDSSSFVSKSEHLWALIDGDTGTATVVRGRGATAASSPGTGVYTVTFNRDITTCGIVATLGDATGTTSSPGEIAVDQPVADSVSIRTFDSTGAAQDTLATNGFYIEVTC